MVGSTLDVVQWSALLESTSALHMYRKRFGRIAFLNVMDFLILDRYFPRSMRFCLAEAEEALHAITGSPLGTFSGPAEQQLGVLNAKLNFSSVEDIRNEGLHEFIDDAQQRINDIGAAVSEQFFRPVVPEPVVALAPSQTQSQSAGATQLQSQG